MPCYLCTLLMKPQLQIVECPRDAMQGWPHPIATADKAAYLNALLEVGFPLLDCGSFVSPKAIPQMVDTAAVLAQIAPAGDTKLLVIVANERGIDSAVSVEKVHYLGFPLSLSETFQQRNTGKSIAEALDTVQLMQEQCLAAGKEAVVYLSMGFGNPYGDDYSPGIAADFTAQLVAMGIRTIALADTVGVTDPPAIQSLFEELIPRYPGVTFSAHLHSTKAGATAKMEAAWAGGCRRFEGAIGGIGGCPMANDELVGNLATEQIVEWAAGRGITTGLNEEAFQKAQQLAHRLFI